MVQISESNPNDMEYHTITLIFLKKKSFNEICLLLDIMIPVEDWNPVENLRETHVTCLTTSYMLVYVNYSSFPELAGRKWQALLEFIISEIAEVNNPLNSLT